MQKLDALEEIETEPIIHGRRKGMLQLQKLDALEEIETTSVLDVTKGHITLQKLDALEEIETQKLRCPGRD